MTLARTLSPYELRDGEVEHLLALGRELVASWSATFPTTTAVYSTTRERTPHLTTETTRYGEAHRGFEVNRHAQRAGRSVKLSAYGLPERASLEIYSTHWLGHSDTGRGVTLHLGASEQAERAVSEAIDRMEESRRQCPNGGLLAGADDPLPTDPRVFARRSPPTGCNRLRCAQCGAFVRQRISEGARLYECACASTTARALSLPLRGDCDTSYAATWWCAGHPSSLEEIDAADRALPTPWCDVKLEPEPPTLVDSSKPNAARGALADEVDDELRDFVNGIAGDMIDLGGIDRDEAFASARRQAAITLRARRLLEAMTSEPTWLARVAWVGRCGWHELAVDVGGGVIGATPSSPEDAERRLVRLLWDHPDAALEAAPSSIELARARAEGAFDRLHAAVAWLRATDAGERLVARSPTGWVELALHDGAIAELRPLEESRVLSSLFCAFVSGADPALVEIADETHRELAAKSDTRAYPEELRRGGIAIGGTVVGSPWTITFTAPRFVWTETTNNIHEPVRTHTLSEEKLSEQLSARRFGWVRFLR